MPLAIATAISDADAPNYLVKLEAGTHTLIGDEPRRESGQDRGPAMFEFVLSGLAAGSAATLRMSVQKKAWSTGQIEVIKQLHIDRDGIEYMQRTVFIDAVLDEAQWTHLAKICEKTPVTLFIKRGTRIDRTIWQ